MTITDSTGAVATPESPPLSRSPEDLKGPRDSGSASRTKPSPIVSDTESNPYHENLCVPGVKYQREPPGPLDTINVGRNKPSVLVPNPSARSYSGDSNTASDTLSLKDMMEQVRVSPRSIENMNIDTPSPSQGAQANENPSSNRSRSEDSNRNGSKKNGRQGGDHPTQIQFGSHGSMVVPSTIIGPPPRAPSPYNSGLTPPLAGAYPSQHSQQARHSHRHRRAESWSGNMIPMAPPSPVPNLRAGVNPALMPPLYMNDPQNEMNPLLQVKNSNGSIGASSTSSRRKRKSEGGHRRAHSSGSAYPNMYGNFFQPPGPHESFDLPPPPPPQSRPPHMEQFSPRGEFMKLTSSFRGTTPPSPSGRKGLPPINAFSASPQGTPRSVRSGKNVGFSPLVSSTSPTHRGYGAIPSVSTGAIPDFPVTAGGEAVFLAQKTAHGRHSHRESSRKRHMRQQSAQLFMEEVKGIHQPPACRDIVFLLLFMFHIVGVVFLGNTYGPDAFEHNDVVSTVKEGSGEEVHLYYANLIYIAGMSGAFAVAFSLFMFGLMTLIARRFVQVALFLAVSISFAWGTIGIGLSPKNVVPITGFIALAVTVAYSFIVWERIPFCNANLVTAMSAIKANLGAVLLAVTFQILAVAYCVYYSFVVVGVYDAIQEEDLVLSPHMQIFAYTMLGVSFYWTYHVILNVVQVTTAGVVADWWYHPEDANVYRSFTKSVFYSIGSICFGSLLVGPVRLLRQFSAVLRPSADSDSALMCMHECMNCIQTCVTSCVDGLANHFNSWAFTYIGIYGYGFLDAGSNATELFQTRGWSMIVTDDLVPNVLLMSSLVVGGATGLFAHLIEGDSFNLTSLGQPGSVSFAVGIVLGLVVTSILFGIISSSVNAVLVCFAASPVDFETTHPELSHEMRNAWREVWPGCMDVVDLRVALAQGTSLHGSQRGSGIPAEFL